MFSRLLRVLLISLLLFTTGGCNLLYRMDIQQGNVITQEMVDKLRAGMTRSQVRFVLGTPLVSDPFRPDRWDYFYSFRHGVKGEAEQRRLTVIFKGDHLVRLEGDVVAPKLKTGGDAIETAPTELVPTPFNTDPATNSVPDAASEPAPSTTQTDPTAPSTPLRAL